MLGPLVLFILDKMTHFFSSFVYLPLKIGQPGHLLLLPLHLLMDYLHVSDFLVQLFLLECCTSGLPLLASGLSKRKGHLARVQWLQCSSPWCGSFLRWHDEGQCLPKVVEKGFTGGGRQCWGLVLECYKLRTRQHKNRLFVNTLRPSEHYFPKDIMIFGRRS